MEDEEDPFLNDPIYRSYRSLISTINKTSETFRRGEKWRCSSLDHHYQERLLRMEPKTRRLVRQQATIKSPSDLIDDDPRYLKVQQPSQITRQWTVDTCTGLKSPPAVSTTATSDTTAFLLRPVPRQSEEQPLRSPKSLKNNRLMVGDIVASKSVDYGSRSKIRISTSSQNRRKQILMKQRTSESAPSGKFGGSSVNLLRQMSNASEAGHCLPTSYSHQGITLVRGTSCSLVDIPTYLGPSMVNGVELAQVVGKSAASSSPPSATLVTTTTTTTVAMHHRPRLQLDLTRKRNETSLNTSSSKKGGSKKTQWMVLCVALTLLTMCVTLVGTMLSVGSQYPEMLMAKRWDQLLNGSREDSNSSVNVFEEDKQEEDTFIIVPDVLIDENHDETSGMDNLTVLDYKHSAMLALFIKSKTDEHDN